MRSLVWLVALLFFNACSAAELPTEPSASLPEYDSARMLEELRIIEATARVYSDESSNWQYFKNPRIQLLYASPSQHVKASVELWRMRDVPIDLKRLSVRLLQCMSLADYLELIESAWLDAKRGLVPLEVVETLIAPGSDWGTKVELSFNDASVVRLLERVASDASSTQRLRETIAGILSGDAAEYVRAYNLPTEPLPRLSCTTDRR